MYKKFKWQEIYEKLKTKIENREYDKGERFLKIKDICKNFGVSEATARRVLNEFKNRNLIIQKQRLGTIVKMSNYKIYLLVPEESIERRLYLTEFTSTEILRGIIEEC